MVFLLDKRKARIYWDSSGKSNSFSAGSDALFMRQKIPINNTEKIFFRRLGTVKFKKL